MPASRMLVESSAAVIASATPAAASKMEVLSDEVDVACAAEAAAKPLLTAVLSTVSPTGARPIESRPIDI